MLERSLKKPPKSRARAKARALTVLRVDGATSRASAQHVLAKLPRDLEEQIAVVRGRAGSSRRVVCCNSRSACCAPVKWKHAGP